MSVVSIGGTLKEARSRKSISLEEVHTKTKIHPRVLQLLEEDKFDKLPSPLFARSFLKAYAEFLEVNSEDILKTYERIGQKDPDQVLFIKPASHARQKSFSFDSRLLVAAALVLSVPIAAGLIYYAVKNVRSFIPALSTKRAADSPRMQPAQKQAAVSKKADWLRSVEQGNFPEIPAKTPLELKIKALDNVWIRVTCDGKVLFQSILKRGASETWQAGEKIEIWTGNSSNMYLSLNTHGIGSPGKGVVKKMLITREGIRIAK